MYNRYIPEDTPYIRVDQSEQAPSPPPSADRQGGRDERPRFSSPARGPGGLGDILAGRAGLGALLQGREGSRLSGALRALGLEGIDTGDLLLLLIILLLLSEGDDLELVIALGLALIMGPGEPGKEPQGEG